MKKNEIIFGSLKVPLDFIIIFSSFFIARKIRLMADFIPNVILPIQTIDTKSLIEYSFICAMLFIFLFSIHSMYFIKINNSKIKEFLEIIRYSFYCFVFFSVIVYLGKGFIFQIEIPRLIIIYAFIVGTLGVILERILLNNLQYFLIKKGFIAKKKLILINNKNLEEIKHILNDIKDSKIYTIIGYSNSTNLNIDKLKYIGGLKKIQNLFEKKLADEILYIDSDYDKNELLNLWELSRIFGVRYRYITNFFDITKTNTSLSLINTIPTIEINNTPLDNWGKVLKRIFDIFAGIFGLIIFSPIILIVSILIKLEDPKGPVFYINNRIGQNGKIFRLYKFRYMKWEYCIKDSYGIKNNEDIALKFEQELIKKSNSRNGPLYKIKNDPRKTKIGKLIEKYSIDEIPQFFNIIIGNMSLVGPRPHQEREVKNYSLEQKRLLTIKPGITGMAQVNGREKNDFEQEAKLDIFYIENWSILLDLKIVLKTFLIVLGRK